MLGKFDSFRNRIQIILNSYLRGITFQVDLIGISSLEMVAYYVILKMIMSERNQNLYGCASG